MSRRKSNVSNLNVSGNSVTCDKEKARLFAGKLEKTFTKTSEAIFADHI